MNPPGSDDDHFNVGRAHGEGNDDTGRLIRPYAITRGRTAADVEDISLEAQLQTTALGQERAGSYRWEAAKMLQLALTPMALIEVAARAEVPIGVARVVLADLIADGAIAVQRINTQASTATYRNLLERVLDGVRSL